MKGRKRYLLVLVIVLALVGCSGNKAQQEASQSPGPSSANNSQEATESGKIKFPLQESATLKFMAVGTPEINQNELQRVKEWSEMTNVKVDFDTITATGPALDEKKNLMFVSNDYPESFYGGFLNDTDVMRIMYTGILKPLDPYITKELMPNLTALLDKHPSIRGVITAPDGHIYTLPRYEGRESNFLENAMYINKKWLDALGLPIPTTTTEFLEVLKAFKEKDPNGNGKRDEIPYTFVDNDAFAHMEALFGIWGLPIKHGLFDSFVVVRDGKVEFGPIQPEYKEGIKFYANMHKAGALDVESFTQKLDQFTAKIQRGEVGAYLYKGNIGSPDDYVAIPPLKAEGYEPVWFYHPGSIGTRNLFAMTDKNKQPELTMAFIDYTHYTAKDSILNFFGPIGQVFTEDNGMLKFLEDPSMKYTVGGLTVPGVLERESVGTLVENHPLWQTFDSEYELYKPYLNKTPWPRPYVDSKYTDRLNTLKTDIFNHVNKNKAQWTIGGKDVESEWENHIAALEKMGLQEFLNILQEAYDNFMKGQNQ